MLRARIDAIHKAIGTTLTQIKAAERALEMLENYSYELITEDGNIRIQPAARSLEMSGSK
jgi:hypothetical protein